MKPSRVAIRFRDYPVNEIAICMEVVVSRELFYHKEQYQTAGNAKGQTGDINKSAAPLP